MAKAIESWRLFWMLALATSVAICSGLPLADFHSAQGTAPMISRSVRCALPLFLLAFTASSLATLWPNKVTRWLLRNRRYLGLGFAFGMAWHFSFVAYSIFSFGLSLTPRGLALDLIALFFLVLMTLTSFRWFARRLTAARWRRLHKTGAYAIWFVPTYIYLHSLLPGGDVVRVVAFSLFIAAWLLRVFAWVNSKVRGAIPKSTAGGMQT
jgi:DMSO/TMAO reductase YedYZ heme-binding membrane subunit